MTLQRIAAKIVLIFFCLFIAAPLSSKTGGGGGGDTGPKPPTAAELKAAEEARREADRLKILAQQRAIHYGDKIVLRSKFNYAVLTGPNTSNAGLDERKGSNDKKNSDEANQLWFVKGKHSKKDPWNCIPGEDVKNGDTVRLECVATGVNLSASGSGENVALCLNGTAGIGTSKDNWIITTQGGRTWNWGAPCTLVNVDTNFVLNVNNNEVDVIKSIAATAKPVPGADVGMDKATQDVLKAQQDKAQSASDKAQAAQSPTQAGPPSQTPTVDAAIPSDPPSTTWWVCNAQVAQPPEDDVAWSGSPAGSPAEADDSATISIEIVKLGMGGGIKPHATQDFSALSANKKPFLSGFAKDTISQFTPGYMLTVNPLKNKGAAWLGESLKTPGKATILFKAKSEDKGDIQVVFGNDVGIDFVYKIRIGAYDNTKTVIEKYERRGGLTIANEVASITQEQNPLAVARPGSFSSYWVSINNGLIFLGAGNDPGENIFLSWRDPSPSSDLRRVAFATNKQPVVYTEIQVRPPVNTIPPLRKYYPNATNPAPGPSVTSAQFTSQIFSTDTSHATSEEGGNAQWSAFPLRVPGRGSVGFTLNATKETALIISKDKTITSDYYAIVFGANGNDGIHVKKHLKADNSYQTLATISSKHYPALNLNSARAAGFWVSLQKGQLLIGMGSIGENIVLGVQDLLPLSDVVQLGFLSNTGETGSFSNLNITSPITLDIKAEAESYRREAESFKYAGAVYIVLPFEYQIDQEGQAVKFVDKIGGQTFYPGATPQQNTQYLFMITVQPNGFPQLDWISQPENPQIISLQRSIAISTATSEALSSAGQSISGSGMIGGVIGTIASMALAGASAGIAASQTAKNQAELASYRDVNSYVYTDKMNTQTLGSAEVPPEAQANALDARSKLDLGGKWTPSSTDKFERLVSLYQQVIFLINHPYVVQDPAIKQNLFGAITALYNARKTLYPGLDYQGAQAAYNSLLNLLISAQDNQYLINQDKPDEAKQKDVWYTWINELTRDLLAGHAANAPVELQPFHGEYVWLSETLPEKNKGIVVFEAKGLNDVMVAFGQSTSKTRNTSNEIYEIDLGGWENTKTAIRVQSLDTPIAQFSKDEQPDAMLNALDFKRFWIALNGGTITIGIDEIKEANKILEWTDVYPISRLKYVGLSTWDAPINFKNIYVGPFNSFKAAAEWDAANKKKIADAAQQAADEAAAAAEAAAAQPQ
jgi:hypothetical protein